MLKSESSKSKLKSRTGHAGVSALCLLFGVLILIPAAFGQDFTLQMDPFPPPDAIDPGGIIATNLTLGALNGFNGTVDLTCQITSQPAAPTPPTCMVSPSSVKPAGGASVTVSSIGSTTPTIYSVTVTGTATGAPTHTQSQNLTVLAVSPQFTITIGASIVPNSVHAGSGGQGTISINPINGYGSGSGGVTLSCSSITPLVTIPPVCSFNPQPVMVNGTTATSTITISTIGPVPKAAVAQARGSYALWLPLPMLALVGLGAAASGKRSRPAWGLLALFMLSGSLLLMPACGSSYKGGTTTNPTGVTPNNTYTFTVTGVDSSGNTSSNTGTTTNPTVSLTVN